MTGCSCSGRGSPIVLAGCRTNSFGPEWVPNQNAIGNLVLHLCGNVQQWIVSGVGGEAGVRDRAAEFAQFGGLTAGELQVRLDTALNKAGEVIRALPASRLTETIMVQHQ